jgi:hypothetical protein
VTVFHQERQDGQDRRVSERLIDIVERLHVAEKAQDEFLVAKMMNGGPQEGPSHRQSEKQNEYPTPVQI